MLVLFSQANSLSESICGKRLLPHHHTPTIYNETELFGVSYLYKQCDRLLELSADNLSANEKGDEVDEGFIEDGDTIAEASALSEDLGTVGMGVAEEDEEPGEEIGNEVNQKSLKLVFNCLHIRMIPPLIIVMPPTMMDQNQ